MGEERQKIQYELAFPVEERGEAPMTTRRGTETPMAERNSESPARTGQIMEEVCERENLKKALKRVQTNKGSPGIDGMTVKELSGHLKEHWPDIRQHLLEGTYRPQPVRRAEIPKPDGGIRKLGIPTVLDRFIQQAVMQVLQRQWDRTFSEHSYGFRPGRSAHQAIAKAQGYITEGYRYVVDIDLEKFFDKVNHDKLMGQIAKRITDKRCLKLIRAYLNAGVMEDGLVRYQDEGTPQGGPLSPLLSNIVLDELDKELERRGHRFVRYADDCNIYVRSERAGLRVMEGITEFITRKLKLKVNAEKSAVASPWKRKFLGFSFTNGRKPKRRVSAKAIKRFKERIRELTGRMQGRSVNEIVKRMSVYMKGWLGYFAYCETPSVFHGLDSWIRRRLRSIIWKQGKRGRTRYEELRKQGVDRKRAAQTASSCLGPWRLSYGPVLNLAWPGKYFSSLGLPTMEAYVKA